MHAIAKVRARYDVWPSAYASGALVMSKRLEPKNWGKSKKTRASKRARMNSSRT